MIVVVGRRHDRDACGVVAAWPDARLLSAEDLTSVGWEWAGTGDPTTWVVDGDRVADEEVSGVFVRRSTVYPDELGHVHPDDRVTDRGPHRPGTAFRPLAVTRSALAPARLRVG